LAVKVGTVGKPIRNVRVRIADDGEIEVTGPGVMRGYYHKDDATRDAFTHGRWFRTGDIGHMDNDGFLYITDRKKELFKTSGGKYIAPSPIEQLIRSSRFISQDCFDRERSQIPGRVDSAQFRNARELCPSQRTGH
jgi:long-chain acyl-CoA synthetase